MVSSSIGLPHVRNQKTIISTKLWKNAINARNASWALSNAIFKHIFVCLLVSQPISADQFIYSPSLKRPLWDPLRPSKVLLKPSHNLCCPLCLLYESPILFEAITDHHPLWGLFVLTSFHSIPTSSLTLIRSDPIPHPDGLWLVSIPKRMPGKIELFWL